MLSVKRLILIAAVFAALLLAGAAQAEVRELGSTTTFPAAACPTSCSVIAKVTGYQAQVGAAKNPFVVPKAGRIVAFTVALGSPSSSQLSYFTKNFGKTPELRVAVLQPVAHSHALRLVAQSEIFNLTSYLGTTPTFALATSLRAPAHSIIALTTPTWAPAFAVKRPTTEQWRSFRTHCTNNTETAVHQTLGTSQTYACLYRNARLLYSATYIPNPTPAKKPTTKKSRRR